MNDTKDLTFLTDTSKTGRMRPWAEKHAQALKLAEIYTELGFQYGEYFETYDENGKAYVRPSQQGYYLNKASRLRMCGRELTFHTFNDSHKELVAGMFCNVRLCPTCIWRKSQILYAEMSNIIKQLDKDGDYAYLFLTLTCKNCQPTELDKTITDMLHSWQKLTQTKRFRKISLGWFRALEVTYNNREETFHPHIHGIIVVRKSYFKKKDYIKHKVWQEMWMDAMELNYIPEIDIRRVENDTSKAIAEIAKYTVKANNYIFDDITDSKYAVFVLDYALQKRRLVAFGGIFKKLHHEINLSDNFENKFHFQSNEQPLPVASETYLFNTKYNDYTLDRNSSPIDIHTSEKAGHEYWKTQNMQHYIDWLTLDQRQYKKKYGRYK